jgi:hypothetical protein
VGVDADGRRRCALPAWPCGGPPWVGRPWSASAWEESPRGTTVTGHNPRVGQAADQASVVGQADAGTTADSSDLKATPPGVPVAQRVIPRCRHQSLTAILPDRLHHTHSC